MVEGHQAYNEYRKALRRAPPTRISDTAWISAFEKSYHRLHNSDVVNDFLVWATMDLMKAIRVRDESYWLFLQTNEKKENRNAMELCRLFMTKSAIDKAWEQESSSEVEDEVFAEKQKCDFYGKQHLILGPKAHWKSHGITISHVFCIAAWDS